MQTNLPEIKSADLKAALDFLTGPRDASATPARVKRSAHTARPVVTVHHGINRDRIRAAKTAV
ncbi:hypothetical protein TA3x_005385 [Tundrisphaera sp. TA3]|uniref:hypothetical protein n=1 Tax=Tundrisphaera sp. TA3 TaxID=3435775 RepID=UPI003EBB139B